MAGRRDQGLVAKSEVSHDQRRTMKCALKDCDQMFRSWCKKLGPRFWTRLTNSAKRKKLSQLEYARKYLV